MGPGAAFKAAFKDEAEIVSTIVCGDSYFNENLEEAKSTILAWVKELNPDVFIAGPAFNAGRYGVACGTICDAVQEELGIPAVTGMYVENPGADMFKNKVYTVPTKNNAAGARDAVKKMAPLALKLAKKEAIGASCQDNYMPNGVRVNFFEEKRGSRRAVDMLLNKLADKPYTTEYPMPAFDRVAPQPAIKDLSKAFEEKRGSRRAVDMLLNKLADKPYTTEYPMPAFDRVAPQPAIKDLSKATIALVTSGGIVPKGNPDHIESSNASHYGEYDITGVMDLTEETYETAHGGYDPVYANEDADRVLPVDVLREMEKNGVIGKLHNKFYTTVGNGTAVASAKAFSEEFAQKLIADGVDAVILTST